jgi:monofunctional biosynthetic peptidoglycan transglycosylase
MGSPPERLTAAKPRRLRRVLQWTAAAILFWMCAVWPPPVWWRSHWPHCTAMMREHAAGAVPCPAYRPAPLSEMSPLLQRMVIIGEDSRFRTHHGIDPTEIADALQLDRGMGLPRTVATVWRRRDRLRGASTITQQLAKNLYLSPSRNPLRKLKEAVTAVRLELALPKDRILELYLDLVEWGPGVWGADPASRNYFGVPPAQLDDAQAAALAATLPHPLTSNPFFRSDRMVARRDLILARFYGRDVVIPVVEEEVDSIVLPAITAPLIPSVVDSLLQDTLHVKMDSLRDTTADTTRDTTRDTTKRKTPSRPGAAASPRP